MTRRIAFRFDGDLAYQRDAISSVVDLFRGMGNPPVISERKLLNNLRDIQLRNSLDPDPLLNDNHFTVEMETGTGKTYVYLRTILELHRIWGFTKFMIVVPSIAIRKGVEKSIGMLREHFMALYDGLDLQHYSFVYDSGSLQKIHHFVDSHYLSIAVMNIQAFNKETNRLRQSDESGQVLWERFRELRPIVLIDEPQRLEGTPNKRSAALNAVLMLDPLFVLRYSATHKRIHHQLYRLNSFDAFRNHLVKKIVVKTVHGTISKDYPYIRYVTFTQDLFARIEIFHVEQGGAIRTKMFNVRQGANLYELSGYLPQYRNMMVSEDPHKLKKLAIGAEGQGIVLAEGDDNAGFNGRDAIRIQIRLAIRTHLDKQLKILRKRYKIKVLTLFFIDAVHKYRDPAVPDGRGEYLRIFDEEYASAMKEDRWRPLFDLCPSLFGADYDHVHNVREGYFAVDKHRNAVEIADWETMALPDEMKLKQKAQEDIDRGIELILEKKDELISLEEPLAFIFSHSALREGWDNPNVFTLCTLKRGGSEIAKKQEIGRGLRLPVDIYGERCIDPDINELTIIANDYFDAFAASLQRDFNEHAGIQIDEGESLKKIPIINGDEQQYDHEDGSGLADERGSQRIGMELGSRKQVKIDHEAFIQACIEDLNENFKFKQLNSDFVVESGRMTYKDQQDQQNQSKLILSPDSAQSIEAAAGLNSLTAPNRNSELEILNYLMYHTMLPRLAIYRIIVGLDRKELLLYQDTLDLTAQKLRDKLKEFKAKEIL